MKSRVSLFKNVLSGFCLAATLSAAGQTYLLDFGATGTPTTHGPAPGDPSRYWNNIADIGTSPIGQLLNLVDSDNGPSDIDFFIIDRFNGVNENGLTTSPLYPVNATRDSLHGNTEAWNGITNIFPKFKLASLDPGTTYNLTFYASRGGVSDNRETTYTVEGQTTKTAVLDAANNVDAVATVTEIKPSAAGELVIGLTPSPNNNNSYHFTYLGVLRLDAVPPQTPIGFTVQPVSQRVAMFRPVTFTAAVTGAPPYTIQWYQDGSPIFGANGFSYTIDSAGLELSGAQFSVSVSNLVYGTHSTNATLLVLSDTNSPTISAVRSVSGLNVEVFFDEALEPALAAEPSFYTVNGQAPASAFLLADGKTVLLMLTELITGDFTVVANYLVDLAGNPIAQDATATGTVLPLQPESLLFDFGGGNTTLNGPAPDDLTNVWNNVTASVGGSDTGELPNLVTSRGRITDHSLVIVRRFNGINENGTQTGGPFPSDATRDSLYGNTESFNNLTNIYPSFKLTGLDTNLNYLFAFYASRTGVSDNRETVYTIEGASTVTATLNASANITNMVTTGGVMPGSTGEITVSLAPSPRNNNGNHFTYLGVMKVVPVEVQPEFTSAKAVNGQLQLQWTGDGALRWAASPEGPWTAVTPAPSGHSHSEPILDTQGRFFRLAR